MLIDIVVTDNKMDHVFIKAFSKDKFSYKYATLLNIVFFCPLKAVFCQSFQTFRQKDHGLICAWADVLLWIYRDRRRISKCRNVPRLKIASSFNVVI